MNSIRTNPMPLRTLPLPATRNLERLPEREQGKVLADLQVLTKAALAHLSISDLLPALLGQLTSVFSVDTAAVLLRDPDIGRLELRASVGFENEPNGEVVPGQDLLDRAAQERQAVIIEDMGQQDGVPAHLGFLKSMMISPLIAGGDLIGLLHLGSRAPRHFEDRELTLLQLAADEFALSLRNSLLYKEVIRKLQEHTDFESALAISEARYRVLAETAADAIVSIDADNKIVSANPAAARTFGYSVVELVGRPFQELIPQRHRAGHRDGMLRYIRTGEQRLDWHRLELPGLHRDGHEILLEISFAETEIDGAPLFTGTMRDISDRKRTDRILAAQLATTRVLAEAMALEDAAEGILAGIGNALDWSAGTFWIWVPEESCLVPYRTWQSDVTHAEAFLQATERTTFTPGNGLPGRVFESQSAAWIPDIFADSHFTRKEAARRSGLTSAFAFPVSVGSACLGVLEFFSATAAGADERLLLGMEALGGDIGQYLRRREAELRLEEQERVQRFLGQVSATLAALVVDFDETLRRLAHFAVPTLADGCSVVFQRPDGSLARLEVVHDDPSKEALVQELLRYPQNQGGGGPAARVIESGEPLLVRQVDEAFIASVAQDERHADLLRRTGMRSLMIIPLTARGRSVGALTLFGAEERDPFTEEDLETALEFARRAALAIDNARLYRDSQEANRAKSEFLATVSHELRTPLNAVIGYAELLKMGITDPVKAAEYVDRIGLSARHLSQLIEEVLAFSRLEAGREKVQVDEMPLSALLAEVRVIAEPMAADKHLSLEFDLAPDLPTLRTDLPKVRQMLLNVVGNAIKFTSEGSVRLRARHLDGMVTVDVTDTGIGISKADQERILEPFWQVEQGTTRSVGGTGLGLTVTQRYADLLGGELSVDSELGKGSTVTIRLPATYPGPSKSRNGADANR